MSEVKVNKISPRTNCGTVTLGDSGDTFTIPAGVTLTNSGTATGFGPTGAVSWDTTKKTTGFTAVSGVGYFCDTTSAAFTATLPATPSAGAIVAFKDYVNTWDTNNLTIDRNGSKIEGFTVNSIQNVSGQSITLIYVDSTQGWVIIDSAQYSDLNQAQFITATGGTITTCGNYKIHKFTGPGTFTVCSVGNPLGSNSVDYLVVAGGGGGGGGDVSGGGGAGGFRESKATGAPWTASPLASSTSLPVSATGYPITVGSGGAGGSNPGPGTSGNNSVFSTITSTGGGGGARGSNGSQTGLSGGSGGGGGQSCNGAGGTGNSPPTSPPQGNNGGAGLATGPAYGGGGGGGATVVGTNGTSSSGGPGGTGATTSISGSPVAYAGGGGGARNDPGPVGTGGTGGGGNGQTGAGGAATAGSVNTGGGGGGADNNPACSAGAAGGSGIVVIRYKFQ